jgi:carboxyl-terminal processing protease
METKPKNSTVRTIIIGFVVLVLVACSFGGGVAVGHFVPLGTTTTAVSTSTDSNQGGTPQDLQTLFAPFWETWTLVHQQYVTQPVDDTKLVQGAIKGMMASLETGYNYYLTPDEYKTEQAQLNGQDYTGIGAWVDVTGQYLTITQPMKGSPAESAGLKPGDQIIAIDGVSMTGITAEVARSKVLGPEGTQVTLTVRRGDQTPFDVTITRAKINPPLVVYRMLDNNIAYIELFTFGDTADQDLSNALKELMAQNPKGLILDLRYNGGGYLDQGIAVASEFLPADQIVVYEKSGDGITTPYKSLGNGIATSIPMVVLVNEYSASASEIVAGALQDYGRAKLVGVTSFGKGSVQSVNLLDNGQGMVGITIAQWLTPNQRYIQGKGLTPDVEVQITQDDINAGKDPQLDAAIALLSK